jgi:signal transduction histidine kinase
VTAVRARLRHALPDGQTLPAEQFDARHRTMVRVLWAHVVALPLLALAYGSTIPHALLEAVLVGVWPIAATRVGGRRTRAMIVAMGLLTCSAVLVHITNGLIEAHFHFFVAVTALSLYEDWHVYGIAIAYVLLHHGLGPALGDDVFSHAGNAWGWAALHAGFISALCVANVAVWRASERVRQELAVAHEELARRAAALERSNNDLQDFAYAASHDLSAPLRTIASYLQLLERRYGPRLDDGAEQYIGYAVEGATRMRALIDDLLAYSRVERSDIVAEPVDLGETLAIVRHTLATTIAEGGATITSDRLPTVEGDATQMQQLFQNLIANAVKFRHPDRPARIEITSAREGAGWAFTVDDNGIGIEPEQRERVFKMFQRLHGRDEYEGNGIGLAICRKIVERHGGRLEARPSPTGGTRMRVWLPERLGPSIVADVALRDAAASGAAEPAHTAQQR